MTGDGVTISDLAVEDHPGDGIKSYGVKGLILSIPKSSGQGQRRLLVYLL